jgi:hypothetical protein
LHVEQTIANSSGTLPTPQAWHCVAPVTKPVTVLFAHAWHTVAPAKV